MNNRDTILHPKLNVYGEISMLKYLENGDFIALFTYTDPNTGEVKKINFGSDDYKKTEEK